MNYKSTVFCVDPFSTGQYCVLAGLNNISFDGVLEFWDIGGDAPTLMNEASHFMVTNITWDPTGRYVCSSNTYGGHSVENGYNMWNFQGQYLMLIIYTHFSKLYTLLL